MRSIFIIVRASASRGGGQNTGMAFVNLKPWDERESDDLHVKAVAGRAMGALMQIKDAMAFAFAPPPVPELGIATGFDVLPARTTRATATRRSPRRATSCSASRAQSKLLANVRPNGQEDTPQFKRRRRHAPRRPRSACRSPTSTRRCRRPGAAATSTTSSTAAASSACTCRPTRRSACRPRTSGAGRCATPRGGWCRSPSFATSHWGYGSPRLERYNGVSAMEIQGEAAPGVSTGEAMEEIERLVAQLPRGLRHRVDRRRRTRSAQAGAQTPLLYALSLADRVPVPRGAVRELDDPDRGADGRAARHPRRHARAARCAAWSATSTSRSRC